jgi:uncharacterized protein with NRDE domain
MCLISLAWGVSDAYPLVIAANRDEAHERPTAAAAWWSDAGHVFGGLDLRAGGSWLAASTHGRIAAVTNLYEEPRRSYPLSRGALVKGYLTAADTTESFLQRLTPQKDLYGPFNLLLFDGAFHYDSNRGEPGQLSTGIHALSNAALGIAWPKVVRAKQGMATALAAADPTAALFSLLGERGSDRHSSLFIDGEVYGTRASTVILLDRRNELTFIERRYDAHGTASGETTCQFPVTAPGDLPL